jgi:hypothetical protein
MSIGIPAEFISKFYEDISNAGLPVVPELVEEIVYRACEAGFAEDSLNALRYYDVSSKIQQGIYSAIVAKGQGMKWECELRTPDKTYIIGCHSN